jgi:ubiquinone/menaquinone biosynthesis C-methylase UbiE
MILKKILKWYSPMAFDDGLNKLNNRASLQAASKKVDKMLDIGCGDGVFTMEFAKEVKPKSIYGIEYVDETRKLATNKGIKCVKSDLNSEWNLESGKFDLILSSQNIEHMHNTRLYLEECYRCLKPGGRVIILTENLSSWVNVLSLALGWQPFSTTCINGYNLGNPLTWHLGVKKDQDFLNKYQKSGVTGTVGHIRVLAYRGLQEMLEVTGFRNVTLSSTGYLPFFGWLSDFFCNLDPRHGNFLMAYAIKPKNRVKTRRKKRN